MRAAGRWSDGAGGGCKSYFSCKHTHHPWNNGREVPRWGVAEIQKQLGDVIVVINSPPIGHMRSQLTNHQVGIVLDVQAWSEKLY